MSALLAALAVAGVQSASIPGLAVGTSLTVVFRAAWLAVGLLAGTLLSTRMPQQGALLAMAVFQTLLPSSHRYFVSSSVSSGWLSRPEPT